MRNILLPLAVVSLVSACGDEPRQSSNADVSSAVDEVSETDASDDARSVAELLATADRLPVSLDPTLVMTQDDPPLVVMRVGVTFQTMDSIIEQVDTAMAPAGFARGDGAELVWSNAGGMRIDAPGRPSLLKFSFDG